MANEIMIPALPCRAIDETVDFYVALGFEVTYRQERPNNYAVVERGGIVLHFFTMKGYDPAQSYSTCIVLTPEVEEIRKAFMAGAKAFYGKIPVTGIPRIGRMLIKPDGEPGFNMVDPGGNWIRFSQYDGTKKQDKGEQPTTTLGKAIRAAEIMAYSHGDPASGAKVLDGALVRAKAPTAVERVQALISRAGIAIAMDEPEAARRFLSEARAIPGGDDEREAVAQAWESAAEIEEGLNAEG